MGFLAAMRPRRDAWRPLLDLSRMDHGLLLPILLHRTDDAGLPMLRRDGWELRIFKRRQRAFKVGGLTWIVERSFAWLGFNRRLSKDFERHVRTSEAMLDLAAIRLMLNRIAE